jgi:hypothetical protein
MVNTMTKDEAREKARKLIDDCDNSDEFELGIAAALLAAQDDRLEMAEQAIHELRVKKAGTGIDYLLLEAVSAIRALKETKDA